MRRAAPGTLLLGMIWVLLGSSAPGADGPPRGGWTTSRFHGTPDPPPPYTVERLFERLDFDRPVLLESTPSLDRLFLGELQGKVWSFREDPAQADRADLVLDLKALHPSLTALYGLTFHPRFEQNRYIYLCYVLRDDTPDGSRVARFTMRGTDPPTLDPASEKVILTFRGGGHNGGCLAFGKDGYLYISTGDGAGPSPPDPLRTGQDVSDLLSSILRIDVDREADGLAYRVPPDNPLIGVPGARPEIWSYGFRNPWKMSFDRRTGDLWVGDVGWELWELIYRVERGGNYGWSVMEGRQPIHPEGLRGPTPILPPTTDHPHSEAASITGGYVYHGTRLKELEGAYIYGDYQSGKVWGLRHDGQRVTERVELADTGLRLASFGEDRHGELYLVEHERTNGIFRLVPNPARGRQADFPKTLSQTGLCTDTKSFTPAPGVLPYAINAEAWADGTRSERWLAVPGTARFRIDRRGRLEPPEGTVLAKTVTLELTAGDPNSRRRLETQVLHFEEGSWRPYTYLWNEEQTDAELVPASGGSRSYIVLDAQAPGGRREYTHRFAARAECTLCHNPWVDARTTVFGVQSASPLALSTSQLDRDSQLETLERLGYLDGPVRVEGPRLVDPYNPAGDVTERARSYLHVNCSHCHQFNAGGAATILLEAGLRLGEMKAVDVWPTQGTFGLDDARIIAPGRPERSVLFYRIAKTGGGRMPRVGSQRVDQRGVQLIGDWIAGLQPEAAATIPPAEANALRRLSAGAATPHETAEAIRLLTATTTRALRLARAIEQGRVAPAVVAAVAAETREHPSVEVRDLFERFLPDDQRVRRLGDAIDPVALLALPGDAERGRGWFLSAAAAQCRTCHTIDGQGTELGPDLSGIGAKYAKAELLRHILEPSANVEPKYAAYQVATRDGQVHVGLLVERSEREVVLRTAQNQTVRIPTAEIELQAPQPRSLMPEQLLRELTAQQAADLLEFLASLKGR